MKRWLAVLAGISLAIFLPPTEKTEISDLCPVELLSIYREEGMLWVETDTGSVGRGKNLTAALTELEETASGKIFLDTADYVLVTAATKDVLPELKKRLRPATEIVQVCGEVDSRAAADFLSVHKAGLALKDCQRGTELPRLIVKGGRYYLAK